MADRVFRDLICPHKMPMYLANIKNQAKKHSSVCVESDPYIGGENPRFGVELGALAGKPQFRPNFRSFRMEG